MARYFAGHNFGNGDFVNAILLQWFSTQRILGLTVLALSIYLDVDTCHGNRWESTSKASANPCCWRWHSVVGDVSFGLWLRHAGWSTPRTCQPTADCLAQLARRRYDPVTPPFRDLHCLRADLPESVRSGPAVFGRKVPMNVESRQRTASATAFFVPVTSYPIEDWRPCPSGCDSANLEQSAWQCDVSTDPYDVSVTTELLAVSEQSEFINCCVMAYCLSHMTYIIL